MKKIYLLTDYLNRFGSKYNDYPYRSGMDKSKLKQYFQENGFENIFIPFSQVDFRKNEMKDSIVLYTSQEDHGYHYKSYIEDIVYGLELSGAKVIPAFKYLRANNNKVFMEILRDLLDNEKVKYIKSNHFGTIEELIEKKYKFNYPVVIKSAIGAMSTGVFLAENEKQLVKMSKKISRTKYLFKELWDLGRSIKHKGYIRESKYRNKFIVQNFIKGLKNDWKVLIYGDKYYILWRNVRKKDFRASGSHDFIFKEQIPLQILDFAKKIYECFDIPNLSLDIAFDGNKIYLFEFQAIYFGTYTLEYSSFYFIKKNGKWEIVRESSELEKVYVDSIVKFINNKI